MKKWKLNVCVITDIAIHIHTLIEKDVDVLLIVI